MSGDQQAALLLGGI